MPKKKAKKRFNPYNRGKRFSGVKWFTLENGQKVQGTWERAYGEFLLSRGIDFETQPKHGIKYHVPRTGATHNYTPDFYLPETNEYVEITPEYALNANGGKKKRKLRRVQDQNPEITLIILTKTELEEMGVNLRKKKENKNDDDEK